jgi:hypothetical protein
MRTYASGWTWTDMAVCSTEYNIKPSIQTDKLQCGLRTIYHSGGARSGRVGYGAATVCVIDECNEFSSNTI